MTSSSMLLRMGIAVAAAAWIAPAGAQTRVGYRLDIPAQGMEAALKALANTTRAQIVFRSDAMRGKQSKALRGSYTTEAAIAALIRGSDLVVSRSQLGVFVITAARGYIYQHRP